MEEIVGALREVRRSAGRTAPFTVVDGRRDSDVPSVPAQRDRGVPAELKHWTDGPIDVEELRDSEIARLLTENARLNERVAFLLKVIEREHVLRAELAAEQAAIQKDRDAVVHQVRMAVEAELRPLLLVLLRLLEKRRVVPSGLADDSSSALTAGIEHPTASAAETDNANWIIDADATKI